MPQMNPMNWIYLLSLSMISYWMMYSFLFFTKTKKTFIYLNKENFKKPFLIKW